MIRQPQSAVESNEWPKPEKCRFGSKTLHYLASSTLFPCFWFLLQMWIQHKLVLARIMNEIWLWERSFFFDPSRAPLVIDNNDIVSDFCVSRKKANFHLNFQSSKELFFNLTKALCQIHGRSFLLDSLISHIIIRSRITDAIAIPCGNSGTLFGSHIWGFVCHDPKRLWNWQKALDKVFSLHQQTAEMGSIFPNFCQSSFNGAAAIMGPKSVFRKCQRQRESSETGKTMA